MKSLLIAGLVGLGALAQPQTLPIDHSLPIVGVKSYDSAIPLPEQVIGHRIGTRHTRADQIVSYFDAVDAKSPRVLVERQGRSYEGRELIHAIVASPENMKRLDAIQKQNHRLVDEPGRVTDEELAKMPVIVWMGYNVHGNEASASEAAILTLYHLAAARGEWIDRLLANAVIIVAPCYNPDGRDRFANWVNGNRGRIALDDLNDREHREPWPGGRTNHYWFDLNRDWLPLTQVESQVRHAHWVKWRPELTTDFHEMGSTSTYFFQPGVPERVHPLTPQGNKDLTLRFARYHADALGKLNELYFTEERYDDFYPGKGSTYCDLEGSVGILFEQASSRALLTPGQGRTLDFATTIRNQVATSIASLSAAADMRLDFLRHRRDSHLAGSRGEGLADWKGIRLSGDQDRLLMMGQLLLKHEIDFHFDERGILIKFPQPQGRLIQAMFETRKSFEDTGFYDISAWRFDVAFGLQMELLSTEPEGEIGRVAEIHLTHSDWLPGKNPYAYVLHWQRHEAPAAAHDLMRSGVEMMLVKKPFRNGRIAHGDLVIPVQQRSLEFGELQQKLAEAVKKWRVTVEPIELGSGEILSIGGSGTAALETPKIALAVGTGTSSNEAGELWHLLDQEMQIPVAIVDVDRLGSALDKYNTVILAGGTYSAALGTALKTWVDAGGRLIATGTAGRFVSSSEIWKLESRRFTPKVGDLAYGEISKERDRHTVPGTLFEVEFDQTHPLAYHLPKRMGVFRESNEFIVPSTTAGANVARFTSTPVMAGYISPEVEGMIDRGGVILARRQGAGSVIVIDANPHFRTFFYGSNRILMNAIFFGGSF